MSSNQVVKLRKKDVAACMTCPICNKLLRDATAIPECLHTFCRKCITRKLTDEELECCPICNIDLGCVPLEKLRPDLILQNVRRRIFPSKRRSLVTIPVRQKKRSLSSLVSTPRVSPDTTLTKKRSNVPARKKPRGSTLSVDKSVNKKDPVEDDDDSSSSREILNKSTQNLRQKSSTLDPSSNPSPDNGTKNGKTDPWNPLNCLVEVANADPQHNQKSERYARKSKGKDQLKHSKFQDENLRSDVDVTKSVQPKKIRKKRKNKADSEAVIDDDDDANNDDRVKRIKPIWFHLVPCEEQRGEPLRQIKGSFVRLKDGNIPISIIQKFVKSKLKLGNEHEVELRCMGQPLVPMLLLDNLMEKWIQKQPTSQTVSVMIGSSANEYVMEISYATKAVGAVSVT